MIAPVPQPMVRWACTSAIVQGLKTDVVGLPDSSLGGIGADELFWLSLES